jgi:hypothetical protein
MQTSLKKKGMNVPFFILKREHKLILKTGTKIETGEDKL